MIRRFCVKADLSTKRKKNLVYGYALRWDDYADLGYLREKFERGAFPEEVRENTKQLIAHQPGIPLGNVAASTLGFKEDKKGLYFENKLNEDSVRAQEIILAVQRGDLTDVSIGFSLSGGKWRIERDDNEDEDEREPDTFIVERVGLLRELSYVDMGAYPSAKIGGSRDKFSNCSYRCYPPEDDEVMMLYREWQRQINEKAIDRKLSKQEKRANKRLKKIMGGIR